MHTLWQRFVGVLLLICWINTMHVCVAVNNALMFFFAFPDHLLVSSTTAAMWRVETMFTRRLSWRESRSTLCFIRKVTSPFFDILASSIMSLGKPRCILVVPHMLLLLDNYGTYSISESLSFASYSSITASKLPSSWIFLFLAAMIIL
jgi:hypothetical protein